MAERRPPGFNVDLGFYDSPEVLSIPRKIRTAAVGVWTLCGAYSASKLSDGHVPEEKLRELGCTPAVRAALCATTPEPLWVEDESRGGIQFTRWRKWQRLAAEIKAYRESEAERKRLAREARKNARKPDVDDTCGLLHADVDDTYGSRDADVPTDVDGACDSRNAPDGRSASSNAETSGRTSGGRSQSVRPEDRDPKSKTESKSESFKRTSTPVRTEPHTAPDPTPAQSATPGADLVRKNIPAGHPDATLTALRIQASELVKTGTEPEIVAAALQLWNAKPGVGIGRTILSSLCSEVIKSRAAPVINGHAPTAFERKKVANAAVFASLADPQPTRLELE